MAEHRIKRDRPSAATINQGPTEGSGENARAEEEDESAAGDDALPHALRSNKQMNGTNQGNSDWVVVSRLPPWSSPGLGYHLKSTIAHQLL